MCAPVKLLACVVIVCISVANAAAGIAGAARAAIAKASAEAGSNSASASPPARHQSYATRSSNVAGASSSTSSPAAEGAQGVDSARSLKSAAAAASGGSLDATTPVRPERAETDGWEARFAWGLYHSRVACLAGEHSIGSWALDTLGSNAGVPQLMLRSEELLAESCTEAPQDQQRTKLAERALRLYNHAKWLAERNHAKAAEWRYREASRIARQTRRNVLASHSLGRLGYFLMHWGRIDEAKEVLQESIRASSKSNPLAPYLLGLLNRQDSTSDTTRLLEAEEMIISAGEQPSADLEAERQQLIEVIDFWRKSETSPSNCIATSDVAHLAICLVGHLCLRLRQALGGEG